MGKPLLLDLFCKAGGAGMGYSRAGFEVIGVDIENQPRYPFTFHQADALEFLEMLMRGSLTWLELSDVSAIHASPPCQTYSAFKHMVTKKYESLIEATLDMLGKVGKPYVVENVPTSTKSLKPTMMLCGHQFGLKVYRHRYFATDPLILAPPHIKHPEACPKSGRGKSFKYGFISITGNGGAPNLGMPYLDYAREAMGIDWMSRAELSEAIPPDYTEYIGRQLLSSLPANQVLQPTADHAEVENHSHQPGLL